MLSSWVIYVGVGKLLIFLWMSIPLPDFLEEKKTIQYLYECDLCSGVWIYSILSYFMHMELLTSLGFWYIPFISELITGSLISFLIHLVSLGWKEKFTPVIHLE